MQSRQSNLLLHVARVAMAAALACAGVAYAQSAAVAQQAGAATGTQRARPGTPAAVPQPSAERAVVSVFPTAPCGRVDIAPVVQVGVGKSTVIRPTTPVTRVLLGNPDGSRAARPSTKDEKDADVDKVAQGNARSRPGVGDVDVLLLSPTEVYVLGRGIGSTNVVLLDRSGQCTAFDVVVSMDTGALQTVIGQLLPDEKDVRVSSAFDAVVLSGSVSDATAMDRITDLANAYVRSGNATSNPRIVNMLSMGAPQQVMLEVKVAEISKNVLDKFGINFTRALISGPKARILSGLFGGATVTSGSASFAGPGATVQGANIAGFDVSGAQNLTQFNIDAQVSDGMIKVLAEPTVMAISGKKGSFLAGGKVFIPVANEGSGGTTRVSLEEKEFGVSVAFLPTVLRSNVIDLEVATEVSELNREGIGISVPGFSGLAVLPSFTSRRAKTTVQLQDGQSFAIGGLIRNNSVASLKAFPILGEMPVIGPLFRSTQFQTDKSELVFVITPRLVKPLPPDYDLPTDGYVVPTRRDIHIDGKLEGKAPDSPAAPARPAPGSSGGLQVK